MCVGDCLLQHFVIEVGIVAVHAHIEMLAAKIDSIRPRLDGCLQCVPSAGGSQQLDGFTGQ